MAGMLCGLCLCGLWRGGRIEDIGRRAPARRLHPDGCRLNRGAGNVLKGFFIPFCAAAFGAVVGSLVTARVQASPQRDTARLETRELVILDERNRPAARLKSDSKGTELQIYAEGLNPAISLGVSGHPPFRFLRFFGEEGEAVAGISSAPPDGHATLALGDMRAIRVVLGAFPDTDIPSNLPVDDWGLQFRKPHSHKMFVSINVDTEDPKKPRVGMGLLRQDGTAWVAP